jgi:gamma-glutamylcyclotransferase (GGCT)/AIG2-like uncharacterized protein YtfP
MASSVNAEANRRYLIPAIPKLPSFFNSLADKPGYARLYFARADAGAIKEAMTDRDEIVALFSYGTLRQADVQRATFGRLLEGRPDTLVGFSLSPMTITDPHVIAASGAAVHTIARSSGNSADRVPGTLFRITLDELEAADRYESGAIDRIRVRLASGTEAFVYVSASADTKRAPRHGRGAPSRCFGRWISDPWNRP